MPGFTSFFLLCSEPGTERPELHGEADAPPPRREEPPHQPHRFFVLRAVGAARNARQEQVPDQLPADLESGADQSASGPAGNGPSADAPRGVGIAFGEVGNEERGLAPEPCRNRGVRLDRASRPSGTPAAPARSSAERQEGPLRAPRGGGLPPVARGGGGEDGPH